MLEFWSFSFVGDRGKLWSDKLIKVTLMGLISIIFHTLMRKKSCTWKLETCSVGVLVYKDSKILHTQGVEHGNCFYLVDDEFEH